MPEQAARPGPPASRIARVARQPGRSTLCRKASGGAGNTILIIPRERFHWVSGEDHRVTYALRPTYTITRCKTCGTPLPAEEDARNIYVTAGTLDDPLDAGIKNHIFYGSKADWERDSDSARYFVERSSGPEVAREPVPLPEATEAE